ncbi:MAG: cation:proton antiporter regulatory subunit [Ignavibacteriales bacterium]
MALTFFIILIYIIMIFIEISIISLKVTGMSREKARFQVISLLTSTGFTTRESELITQHPIRRKIAERIMIFKYIGGIIGTATLFNVYVDVVAQRITWNDFFIWLFMLSAIFAILKNKWILRNIDVFVERQLIRQSKENKKRYDSPSLLESEDFGIVDIVLEQGSYLVGLRIKDAGLKTKYIQVLQIGKGDKRYPFPKPEYVFEEGDRLTMYGKLDAIKSLVINDIEDAS